MWVHINWVFIISEIRVGKYYNKVKPNSLNVGFSSPNVDFTYFPQSQVGFTSPNIVSNGRFLLIHFILVKLFLYLFCHILVPTELYS